MSALFLCFFGDSAYWDNGLVVPGYPTGFSYFRPFRYTDQWIQAELLLEMSDSAKAKQLIGQEVVLCARFRTEGFEWFVLPIRKATIRHVDSLPDNHSIDFSVGPLYDFTRVAEFSSAGLYLSQGDQEKIGQKLFFRADLSVPLAKCPGGCGEDGAWAALVNLIGCSSAPPLRKEIREGLFIRVQALSRDKAEVVQQIHRSWSCGEKYGWQLVEGESYELIYLHRVPLLIGDNISLKPCQIKYKAPTGNLELSTSEETLTGNYQRHVISVTARKPSGTYEQIVIDIPDGIESERGDIIRSVDWTIPVRVVASWRYRLRRVYVPLFLLWAGLVGNVVVGYIKEGETDLALIGISALLALVSAVGVYLVQKTGASS